MYFHRDNSADYFQNFSFGERRGVFADGGEPSNSGPREHSQLSELDLKMLHLLEARLLLRRGGSGKQLYEDLLRTQSGDLTRDEDPNYFLQRFAKVLEERMKAMGYLENEEQDFLRKHLSKLPAQLVAEMEIAQYLPSVERDVQGRLARVKGFVRRVFGRIWNGDRRSQETDQEDQKSAEADVKVLEAQVVEGQSYEAGVRDFDRKQEARRAEHSEKYQEWRANLDKRAKAYGERSAKNYQQWQANQAARHTRYGEGGIEKARSIDDLDSKSQDLIKALGEELLENFGPERADKILQILERDSDRNALSSWRDLLGLPEFADVRASFEADKSKWFASYQIIETIDRIIPAASQYRFLNTKNKIEERYGSLDRYVNNLMPQLDLILKKCDPHNYREQLKTQADLDTRLDMAVKRGVILPEQKEYIKSLVKGELDFGDENHRVLTKMADIERSIQEKREKFDQLCSASNRRKAFSKFFASSDDGRLMNLMIDNYLGDYHGYTEAELEVKIANDSEMRAAVIAGIKEHDGVEVLEADLDEYLANKKQEYRRDNTMFNGFIARFIRILERQEIARRDPKPASEAGFAQVMTNTQIANVLDEYMAINLNSMLVSHGIRVVNLESSTEEIYSSLINAGEEQLAAVCGDLFGVVRGIRAGENTADGYQSWVDELKHIYADNYQKFLNTEDEDNSDETSVLLAEMEALEKQKHDLAQFKSALTLVGGFKANEDLIALAKINGEMNVPPHLRENFDQIQKIKAEIEKAREDYNQATDQETRMRALNYIKIQEGKINAFIQANQMPINNLLGPDYKEYEMGGLEYKRFQDYLLAHSAIKEDAQQWVKDKACVHFLKPEDFNRVFNTKHDKGAGVKQIEYGGHTHIFLSVGALIQDDFEEVTAQALEQEARQAQLAKWREWDASFVEELEEFEAKYGEVQLISREDFSNEFPHLENTCACSYGGKIYLAYDFGDDYLKQNLRAILREESMHLRSHLVAQDLEKGSLKRSLFASMIKTDAYHQCEKAFMALNPEMAARGQASQQNLEEIIINYLPAIQSELEEIGAEAFIAKYRGGTQINDPVSDNLKVALATALAAQSSTDSDELVSTLSKIIGDNSFQDATQGLMEERVDKIQKARMMMSEGDGPRPVISDLRDISAKLRAGNMDKLEAQGFQYGSSSNYKDTKELPGEETYTARRNLDDAVHLPELIKEVEDLSQDVFGVKDYDGILQEYRDFANVIKNSLSGLSNEQLNMSSIEQNEIGKQFKKIKDQINELVAKLIEEQEDKAYRASERGFFMDIWVHTQFMSINSFGFVSTQFWQHLKEEHETYDKYKVTQWASEVFGETKIGHKMKQYNQSEENKRIDEWKNSYKELDPNSLNKILASVSDRFQLKAILLIKAEDYGDMYFHDKLVQMGLSNVTRRKINSYKQAKQAYAELYGTGEEENIERTNTSKHNSLAEDTQNDARNNNKNIGPQLWEWAQKWKKGGPVVDDDGVWIDRAKFQGYIEYSLADGKSCAEDVLFYLMLGLEAGILTVFDLHRIDGKYMVRLPQIEYIGSLGDAKARNRKYQDKVTGKWYPNELAFVAGLQHKNPDPNISDEDKARDLYRFRFWMTELSGSKEAQERIQKKAQDVGGIDHDYIQTQVWYWNESDRLGMLDLNANRKSEVTPPAIANCYSSFISESYSWDDKRLKENIRGWLNFDKKLFQEDFVTEEVVDPQTGKKVEAYKSAKEDPNRREKKNKFKSFDREDMSKIRSVENRDKDISIGEYRFVIFEAYKAYVNSGYNVTVFREKLYEGAMKLQLWTEDLAKIIEEQQIPRGLITEKFSNVQANRIQTKEGARGMPLSHTVDYAESPGAEKKSFLKSFDGKYLERE